MPITSFTINGVEVNPLLEGFEIRETEGGVSTLICEIASVGSPVERFSVRDVVNVDEDGVKIFAGALSQTRESGFGGPNLYDDDTGAPQIVTAITVDDHTRLAERVFVTESVADGTTLKAFLTTLVADYLAVFGVTLHVSQVNGPNLPALDYQRKRLSDVLKVLSESTGFLWRIDYDKQLRMWFPGDLAAPFDIDENDVPARWTGDVEVENILGDDYANRVILVVGPLVETNRVETFVGDGVTDTFTLQYTPTRLPGLIHRYESDGVTPAGGETFGVPPDSPLQWEFDSVTNTITRTIGATEVDKVYKLTFDGVLFLMAMAEDAGEITAYGPYEYVIPQEDAAGIVDQAGADALVATILAQRLLAGDQTSSYETRFVAPTLRAGQEQSITAPARALSGDFIITDMTVRAETPATAAYAVSNVGLIRKVTIKKNKLGKWQDTYRDWLGGASKGGSVSVNTGSNAPTVSGPATPFTSVQFNNSGAFGGDAEFTYNAETNSLVCGALSSITAVNPESCQAFGYDCHIADP